MRTRTFGAKARSGDRIFIDWLRNGRGSSAIGAMSPRAHAGGLVSMPIAWDEVESRADPAAFTLQAVERLVARPQSTTARGIAGWNRGTS